MAVGSIEQQQPDVWTLRLAERVRDHEFPPGSRLVLTASLDGTLCVAHSQLLRRSDATFVVARPKLTDRRDRRRDHRLAAQGTVGWSARVWTGSAPAVDVSRSGLKLEVGPLLRVGENVVLDIAGAGRVSAMVVGVTQASDGAARFAHLAFLRADEAMRDAIVAALATDGRRERQDDLDLRGSVVVALGVPA